MPELLQKFKTQYLMFFIGVLALFIQGLLLTNNIENWVDISLWDETLYLSNGISFFTINTRPDWGPIYSFWYFILNLFTSDPVNLYLLNYKVMIILLPMLLYIYLYRLTDNVIVSFFYSYLLLISMMNIYAWPKVSHFYLILLLLSLAILIKVKSNDRKLLIAGYTALIATYIRPEFIVAFLILFLILGFKVIRKKNKLIHFSILTVISIILVLTLGIPFSSGRSLIAFSQGYEYSMPLRERIDEYGKVKEWAEILENNFDNPSTLFDVIIKYPLEVLHLLIFNIKNLGRIPNDLEELVFPSQFIHISNPILPTILVCFISLIPLLLILIFYNRNNISYCEKFINMKFLAAIIFVFSIPPSLGIILFTLRLHYILLLLPIFYTMLAVIFIPFKINNKVTEILVFGLILVLSFIYVPDSSWFGKPLLKNRKTIEYIRNVELKDKINMLEGNGGFVNYLGNNFEWIKISSKTQPFSEFILNKKINMIIDSDKLSLSVYLKGDSTWYKFLNDPPSLGFKEKVLESGMNIFLKDDVL